MLSAELAARLPGYAVEQKPGRIYAGSRMGDHPLTWGLSTWKFSGFDHPCVDGVLTRTPAGARVLLAGIEGKAGEVRLVGNDIGRRGFETMDGTRPVAVVESRGRGEILVTTFSPWRAKTPQDAETMSVLLANAGVALPSPDRQPERVRIFRTVSIRLDGKLDDWTNDIEDRNVSPFRHAQPAAAVLPSTAGRLRPPPWRRGRSSRTPWSTRGACRSRRLIRGSAI